MSYTYILRLNNGSYYVGSTRDLDKRLVRHNNRQVKSTCNKLPLKLVYYEKHKTYSDAFKREREIKSWKKRDKIEKLIGPVV